MDDAITDLYLMQFREHIFETCRFKYLKESSVFKRENSIFKEKQFQLIKDSLKLEFSSLLLVDRNLQLCKRLKIIADWDIISLNVFGNASLSLIIGDLENPFKNLPQEKDFFNGFITDLDVRIFLEHNSLFIELVTLNGRKEKKLLLNPIEVEILKRKAQEFKKFLELVDQKQHSEFASQEDMQA